MAQLSASFRLALVLLASGLALLALARWGGAMPADRDLLLPLSGTVEEVVDTTAGRAHGGKTAFLLTLRPAAGPALPLAVVDGTASAETIQPLKGRQATARHHHGVVYELTSEGATPIAYDATVRAIRRDRDLLCWAGFAALAAGAGLLAFAVATRRRTIASTPG